MLEENLARLRLNSDEMVMQTVLGQIAHPVGRANPYRIGQDGVPRVLPGTGGITISHRIGAPASDLRQIMLSRALPCITMAEK